MSLTGIFTKNQLSIGGIVFDATLEESDELLTEVTRYPIENGTEGNDYAVTRNHRFSLIVGVTDNPILSLSAQASQSDVLENINNIGLPSGAIASIMSGAAGIGLGAATRLLGSQGAALAGIGASIANASYAAGQAMTRSANTLETLRDLQRRAVIFTLTNSRGVYDNCIITNTRQNTTPRNEQGVEITVDIEQLRIMNTERVNRASGLPVQNNDTATTMAQPERSRGTVTVEIVGMD